MDTNRLENPGAPAPVDVAAEYTDEENWRFWWGDDVAAEAQPTPEDQEELLGEYNPDADPDFEPMVCECEIDWVCPLCRSKGKTICYGDMQTLGRVAMEDPQEDYLMQLEEGIYAQR